MHLCVLCRNGGLGFLIRTGNNKWLGNAATYKDFFFPTSTLPEMPLVSAPSKSLSRDAAGIAGPGKTLDAETWVQMVFWGFCGAWQQLVACMQMRRMCTFGQCLQHSLAVFHRKLHALVAALQVG
jgi:hypothetical protein